MPRTEVGDDHLVTTGPPRLAEHGAQRQSGVVGVAAERGQQRRRVVEQTADVDTSKRGRHEPEGRQRAVAAADIGVCKEHPVPSGA